MNRGWWSWISTVRSEQWIVKIIATHFPVYMLTTETVWFRFGFHLSFSARVCQGALLAQLRGQRPDPGLVSLWWRRSSVDRPRAAGSYKGRVGLSGENWAFYQRSHRGRWVLVCLKMKTNLSGVSTLSLLLLPNLPTQSRACVLVTSPLYRRFLKMQQTSLTSLTCTRRALSAE